MSRFSLYEDEIRPSPWQHTWREFKSSHVALVGSAILLLFVFFAFFAPLVTPYDPLFQNTESILVRQKGVFVFAIILSLTMVEKDSRNLRKKEA